jgi:hypothetical protein
LSFRTSWASSPPRSAPPCRRRRPRSSSGSHGRHLAPRDDLF